MPVEDMFNNALIAPKPAEAEGHMAKPRHEIPQFLHGNKYIAIQ